ncbi:hypothetical protein RKE29_01800 [Streptomyces sp. B1866]|uniref:PIN-like domain-containing protein n=1 Tax=Streptomyces sp. B1866 TaxID=3075431 RepID=UPI0028906104|nr:hypothetical protein [Streptomyces sp. B1866]MDT3395393.1 hypothetical protein [Streptomyces sp. B1866]
MRACGWTVHRIGDVFPDDGQNVPDEEWITYGLDRSWVPLSKDGRIKTQARPRYQPPPFTAQVGIRPRSWASRRS